MNFGKTVFSQLMEHLSLHEFRKCVARYSGDYRVRTLSCLDQFYAMAFAQLSYRESLRDIEACLRATPNKLYHLGIRGQISRSTLADANEKRDWQIYRDFAWGLMDVARTLYGQDSWGRNLKNTVYAFDSTIIELCLSLCPWAKFGRNDAAVKVHTLLNVQTQIPSFIRVTPRRIHDCTLLDELPVEAGSVYLMDRGYLDYKRLYALAKAAAYFVTRVRKGSRFVRQCSRPVDPSTGVSSDQIVRLKKFYPAKNYPDCMRRIRYIDPDTEKKLVFLTNNFDWAATTIALLYKSRWQVELFFKWIKQHLRIKAFYGTSENAVKTQLWISIAVYMLIAILKKRLHLDLSLHSILQVLSVNLFEKVSLPELFTASSVPEMGGDSPNQLLLFGF
jgi:uncharacterized protein DUF4372/DDE family transposase